VSPLQAPVVAPNSIRTMVDAFDLPRVTVVLYCAIPLTIGLSGIRDIGLTAGPLLVALVMVSACAAVAGEAYRAIPEHWYAAIAIAVLVPVMVAGGDRLPLAIVAILVVRSGGFSTRVPAVLVCIGAVGLSVLCSLVDPGLDRPVLVYLSMVLALSIGFVLRQVMSIVVQVKVTEDLLADRKIGDERRRLAREVHDVIAHSMTITLLHVTGARLSLREDPDSAEEALARAERVGRASLEDLRKTVRLLSDHADPTLGTSIELQQDLERMCDDFGDAAEISLEVRGDSETVPPFVALTAFRIVQESLTNAVRHAPGSSVTTVVEIADGVVRISVENTIGSPVGDSAGSGRGLNGMFERTSLLGGRMAAGPTRTGWSVNVVLPLDVATPNPDR